MFETIAIILALIALMGLAVLAVLFLRERRFVREGLAFHRRISEEHFRSSRDEAERLVRQQAGKQRYAVDRLSESLNGLQDEFNAYCEAHATSHDWAIAENSRLKSELLSEVRELSEKVDSALCEGGAEADDGEVYAILADLGRRLDEIEGAATESFEAETRASNEFAAGVQNILGYSFTPTAGEV